MRKTLAAGLAALTFGGAVAAAVIPTAADAREWHGGYGYRGDWGHHHRDNSGAVVAGIAGLAIGAALANGGHHSYYHRSYYDYGYAPGYYDDDYDYAPAVCESRRWVWDPYIGRRVLITHHYAC